MDAKKLIEWGLIAIAAWFVLTRLLGAAESVAQSFGSLAPQPSYPAPLFYSTGFVYGPGSYGSPVRWGWRGTQGQSGGYTGRPNGAGGY